MPKVTLYGRFADLAGWRERSFAATTLGELETEVTRAAPALADHLTHPSTLVIVNESLRPRARQAEDLVFGFDDDVAFAPPVSGG